MGVIGVTGEGGYGDAMGVWGGTIIKATGEHGSNKGMGCNRDRGL